MIRYETLPRNKAIRKINKTLASDFIRAETCYKKSIS